MSFPLLDASQFTDGSPESRSAYAQALLEHLSRHGFVRLKNHGIHSDLLEKCFERSKSFFELPFEAKSRIINPPGPSPQRGWSTLGAEKTSTLYGKLMGFEMSEYLKDAREHFDCGPPGDDMFPNRWPSEEDLPEFRPFLEEFYRRCEKVSLDILEALEEALELPPSTFRQQCIPNASEFRLNHYPEMSSKELRSDKVQRIWPHFDLGVITLLFADSVGGLEFQDRERPHEFMPVQPDSRTDMIVNISETLQRWTAEVLPAGLHRVTAPSIAEEADDAMIPERYTIAYFCKAARNAPVCALPPFQSEEDEGQCQGMTALEYQQKRLLTAY